MEFEWNNFVIKNISEKYCIDLLNLTKARYGIMRQVIQEKDVIMFVNSFLKLDYNTGKLSLFENTLKTNQEGFDKLPEGLKKLLTNCEERNGYKIFTLDEETLFYIKLKFSENLLENATNNKEIIVEIIK